ncbi:MAG: glycosyltransferase family 4 protein [Eubacterium sp.]
MKVLFLTLVNIEAFNIQGIYTDLLRTFRNKAHKVTVVCPRERRTGLETVLFDKEDIQFLCIKTGNITQTSFLEKGIMTAFMPWLFIRAIKKYLKTETFDLILYSTPPVTFEKVIQYVSTPNNIKYLLLKDIWPQGLVDLEVFKNRGILYRYFKKKEERLYQISDYIGCMSEANVTYITEHNSFVDYHKVEICPNSIIPKCVEIDQNRVQSLRKKHNLPMDKILFIYGGNLGKPQGIDHIMSCLQICADCKNAYFVIVGSGTEFDRLKQFLEEQRFKNVQLLYQLPKEDYDLLVNSCDIGLIFLDHRFTIPNFPSRVLSYMQASMPVVACTDPKTDIGKTIEKKRFGYWCESDDAKQFRKIIDQICHNKEALDILGKNARVCLEQNYSVDQSYEIIMKHLTER